MRSFRRIVAGSRTFAALAWWLVAAAAPASDATADARYAAALHRLVDAYRASRGVAALGHDPTLDGLAREHSEAMARAGRLSHDGFEQRFGRSGYSRCVENVGWNHPTPQAELDAWKRSPGHDRNLLDGHVTQAGVGVRDRYVTFIACR